VAAWLEQHASLHRLRIDVRGADPELDAVLNAIRQVAMEWRDWATSASSGSGRAPVAEVAAGSEERMTSTAAADSLGVSARAVRLAIAEHRLPAERVGRRWLIDRVDVEHYRARRAA
jgi:excisionase family DNA binding protein